MKLEKTRFGTLEFPDDQLIEFPQGIIGFPNAKRFVILEHGEKTPLRWIQACEVPELALIIIDPLPLVPDYPVERILAETEDLGLQKEEDVAVVAVVTVPPQPRTPTVNLLAPLAMGVTSRRGKQVVLHDSPFHTRHPLVFGDPTGETPPAQGQPADALAPECQRTQPK